MKYDVAIIGSGPGGYVAAIRAAQLGFKTAIIEKYSTLGGTCLNVGCIPSKALLDSSEHYHNAVHKFSIHGIKTGTVKVDFAQMVGRKNEVVSQTSGGINFLMKKNKVDVYNGVGSFVNKNTINITATDGTIQTIETDKTIIATGSKPITPASMNYDKKRIITSTEALSLTEIPKKMVVIGGGVIGLELGSVYARLGTEIEVIEFADKIIPSMDGDCSKELQRSLKDLGFKFFLKHAVTSVENKGKKVVISYKKRDTEDILTTEADYCLIAIGRRPYTDGLGLENIGITLDDKGRIPVNAAVGQTEEQLKAANIPYKSGKFPFKALGRARASTDIEGMVKVLAHKETDEILGVHMVGPRTADMIAEAVALMEFRASAEDAARISHAHPTYTEAFKEAALAATDNRALHV
ncbi:MAG: FAD-dependent oxidoreductase [Saprospiraceae bacterium]|nr:FAD-dependent oxidoreductase [Saprospiraceae bacterium]